MAACIFKACDNAALPDTTKCWFHRNRDLCEVDPCTNQVCARKRCISHGGKRVCAMDGCTSNVRVGSYCGPHGNGKKPKKRCIVDDCTKFAHARHRCVAHGGGRICNLPGCNSQSRNGGFCQRHRSHIQDRSRPEDDVKSIPAECAVQWDDPIVVDFGSPHNVDEMQWYMGLCEVDRTILDVLIEV